MANRMHPDLGGMQVSLGGYSSPIYQSAIMHEVRDMWGDWINSVIQSIWGCEWWDGGKLSGMARIGPWSKFLVLRPRRQRGGVPGANRHERSPLGAPRAPPQR